MYSTERNIQNFTVKTGTPLITRKRLHIVILIGILVISVIVAMRLIPKLMRRFYTHGLEVVEITAGLKVPWSMAFLPDGSMLVSEREGNLRRLSPDGQLSAPISGLPPVAQGGEGGLLGIATAPDFEQSHRLFWSYSEPAAAGQTGASTAVASGRLTDEGLTDVNIVFRQAEKLSDNRHFGGRLLFDTEGRLLIALGDRMRRDDAQRLDSAHGKLMRIMPDGSVPADNPFHGREDALGEILSSGHRNIQGLAINPDTGSLWASEHGPASGDEVNLIKPGANYGWPLVSHGCEYNSCAPIGLDAEPAGIEAPVTWFGPESVPPSALTFVTGERYPEWQGHLLMGVLHSRALILMTVEGDEVVERKPLWLGKYQRIRDVQQGPDGWIYVAVESPEGAILRLVP